MLLCGFGSAEAGQSPATSQGSARIEMGGVSFAVPTGWSSERISGGILLLAPKVERGWQANIFIEHVTDRENRSLDKTISDLIPTLAARKQGFKELAHSVELHPAGLQLAFVEYLNQSDNTSLREREVMIALSGSERLFIVLSSEVGLFGKYQATFSGFMESMSQR
jgi:hypothetical protein